MAETLRHPSFHSPPSFLHHSYCQPHANPHPPRLTFNHFHPSAMASQRIPHELEDLVLQHIRRDSAALKASSLVCYRFAAVSQKHLFSSILLDLSDRSKCKVPPPKQERDPEALRSFLETAPHLVQSIRGIDVIADSYRLPSLDTTLLPCLSLLNNLCHVSLDSNSPRPIYWRYLSPAVHSRLYDIAHSNQLVTLRLRRIFEVPLSLLAECASLEALSLNSVTFQQEDILRILEGRWQLSPDKQPPRLRTLQLSISDDAFRVFLNFLVGVNSLLDISTLAKLSISIFSPRFDYANINRLLHAVDGALEEFCFNPMTTEFPGVPPRMEQFPPLHLHLLSRLQVFRLHLIGDNAYNTSKSLPSSLTDHAFSVMSQLKSDQAVEEITLKIVVPKDMDQDFLENAMATWTALDTTLGKIRALKKLTVFVVQSDDAAVQLQVLSRMYDAFPHLNSKAILRVQAVSALVGFPGGANDGDLLGDTFRRHNMV